jgi:hypothetical protein
MRLHKYNEKQLRDAIATSTSIRQTLIKLGVAPYGGNYDVFRKAVKHFKIQTSHFTGQGHNKGKKLGRKYPLTDYLSNIRSIGSHKLRLRLIKEGVFDAVCSCCERTEWLGKLIPLELDHIDGNNKDNSLSNLRLLCPNCHAQTPTYRGKNKSSKT